jgi:hypothetical protein
MKSYPFWGRTPCSPLKVSRPSEEHITTIFRVEEKDKKETSTKQLASLLVSFLSYSSIPKMEATCSSETLADF